MSLYKLVINPLPTNKAKAQELYTKYKEFKEMQSILGRKDVQLYDKIANVVKDFRQKYKIANTGGFEIVLKRIDLPEDMQVKRSVYYQEEIPAGVKALKRQLTETIRRLRRNERELLRQHKKTSWGEYVELVGRVHTKESTILTLANKRRVQDIFKPKGPQSKENHVGVEVEFASFLHHDDVALFLYEAGLCPYVQLQHEYIQGRHSGEFEYELTIVAPEKEIKSVIEKVCQVLNEKIDANVTFGCGLHVHIDARNRNMTKIFNNLYNSQNLLYSMVAYNRRENKFCKVMEEKLWQPTKRDRECGCLVDPCKHNPVRVPDRYFGLNTWSYDKHKTIEVRIHSGTSNAIKINNWIDLLLSIVDGPDISKKVQDITDLERYVPLDTKLKAYVIQRIKAFAEKHNKDYEHERETLRIRTRNH